jgi:hypothetical protein
MVLKYMRLKGMCHVEKTRIDRVILVVNNLL